MAETHQQSYLRRRVVFWRTRLRRREGIERYPEALEFMFNGGNIGKLLVHVG